MLIPILRQKDLPGGEEVCYIRSQAQSFAQPLFLRALLELISMPGPSESCKNVIDKHNVVNINQSVFVQIKNRVIELVWNNMSIDLFLSRNKYQFSITYNLSCSQFFQTPCNFHQCFQTIMIKFLHLVQSFKLLSRCILFWKYSLRDFNMYEFLRQVLMRFFDN